MTYHELEVACPCCRQEFAIAPKVVIDTIERIVHDTNLRVDALSALLASVQPDDTSDGEPTS